MSESFADASRRVGENRSGPSRSTAARAVPLPGGDPASLITWVSYITILHLLYLVWREASGRSLTGERL
jgi:hypothetical protein